MILATQDWIVRKRDGRVVPFELSRVQHALTNAFRAELNLADGQPLSSDALRDIGDDGFVSLRLSRHF